MEREYLNSSDVMSRFGICDQTLTNWIKRSDLCFPQPVRINGRRYFPRSALEAWERTRQRAVSAPAA